MTVEDGLHRAQPQTDAACFGISRRVATIERRANTIQLIGWYSRALVPHRDFDGFAGAAHAYMGALAVLDGVVDEVADGAANVIGAAGADDILGAFAPDG